jgi:hypothetical protein
MPIQLSKTLLGLEVVLLAFPVFTWWVWVLAPSLLIPPLSGFDWLAKLIALLIVAQLFAAYRIALRFLVGGASGLSLVSPIWWWLCASGVVLSVVSATLLTLGIRIGKIGDSLTVVFGTAAYGILYLIPLGHIVLERRFRSAVPHAA